MAYRPLVIAFAVLCALIAVISAGNTDPCKCGNAPTQLAAQVAAAKKVCKGKVNSKASFLGSSLYFIDVEDCCGSNCPSTFMVKSGGDCAIDNLELYKSYTFLLNDDDEMDRCSNAHINTDWAQVKKLCNGGPVVPEPECPSKTFLQDSICGLCQKLKDKDCSSDPKPPQQDCICTQQYDPVCALGKDGEKKTYGNQCMANCDKAKFLYKGECVNEDCCCSDVVNKVCAIDNRGNKKTFDNQCKARCAGAKIVSQGECPNDCICTMEHDPQCGVTPKGEKKTFGNKCKANCENAVILYKGECMADPGPVNPCGCGNDVKKVCASGKDGKLKTYQNVCLANCDNARPLYNGECF